LLGVDDDSEINGFLDVLWLRLSSLQFTLHRDERPDDGKAKERKTAV
jgi:hypothetical protein